MNTEHLPEVSPQDLSAVEVDKRVEAGRHKSEPDGSKAEQQGRPCDEPLVHHVHGVAGVELGHPDDVTWDVL